MKPVGTVPGALKVSIAGAVSGLKEHFREPPDEGGEGGAGLADDGRTPQEEYPPEIQALIDALGEAGSSLFGTVESLAHVSNLRAGVQRSGDFEFGLSDLLGVALDGSDTLFERGSAPLDHRER